MNMITLKVLKSPICLTLSCETHWKKNILDLYCFCSELGLHSRSSIQSNTKIRQNKLEPKEFMPIQILKKHKNFISYA